MQATDIRSAAAEATKWFETAKREETGEAFVRKTEDAPDWVSQLVYDAHDGMLPDDFKYQAVRDALVWIEDDGEDDPYEFAYANVDTYTSSLLAWLASHQDRIGFCDEAAEEFGETDGGIVGMVTAGQAVELSRVYSSVLRSLEAFGGGE